MLAAGWLPGGNVGIGTIVFAALIGPMVHLTLPLLDTAPRRTVRASDAAPSPEPAGTTAEVHAS